MPVSSMDRTVGYVPKDCSSILHMATKNTIMEVNEEKLKELVQHLYGGNGHFRRNQSGKYTIWENNDSPLQHGNGEQFVISPDTLSKILSFGESKK